MTKHTRAAGAARATLLLVSLFLLLPAAARAQGANTLEGKVAMPGGGPPPQPVRVTLTYNGRRLYETFTDASGRFTFRALGRGRYLLTAEGDGATFETTSVYAEVAAFSTSPQSYTQNVQLIPRRAAASMPAGVVSVEELDPNIPSGAREKYRQGLKSAGANEADEAAKFFAEAVAAHPQFYAAALALGEQYAKLRRYDDALAAYRRASELKPDRPEPYVGVGATLVNQKRYEEGIALLRRVVELDKDLPAPYLPLGYAEMMTGDYRAAEAHLLRAYELAKPAVALIYLANVYEQTGEPAKAMERLQTYLKENPQTPNADSIRAALEKLRKKLKDKK